MPELPEEMYCSQQICIPPAFPYLLRQYAKAAIRTQPTDLLKWSTAYFRCLALNLPPPVKPRLEYPIPLDYHGVTPGWLKTLVNQMPNAHTVSFKLLWDRWIGACLKHTTLIEVLLLGKFTDNQAIPWLKFIALCAGHLTENLTHTMIMVCEILTEEPEGGSAMIPVNTFMDIYRFLADIDASKPQHLPNIYFTDSVLGLYEKEESEKSAPSVISSEQVIAVEQAEEEDEASLSIMEEEDTSAVVSCPDITAEEKPDEPLDKTDFPPKGTEVLPDSIDKTFEFGGDDKDAEGEEDEDKKNEDVSDTIKAPETDDIQKDETGLEQATGAAKDVKDKAASLTRVEDSVSYVGPPPPGAEPDQPIPVVQEKPDSPISAEEVEAISVDSTLASKDDRKVESEAAGGGGGGGGGEKVEVVEEGGYESVDTVQEDVEGRLQAMVSPHVKETDQRQPFTEEALISTAEEQTETDTEHLEMKTDDESTGAQEHGAHEVGVGQGSYVLSFSDGEEEYGDEGKRGEDEERDMDLPVYEWFDIPVVPGIGPTVPLELVEIVNEYMTKMAKIQHGVVMPRNIRHFSCPPLEIFDFQEE